MGVAVVVNVGVVDPNLLGVNEGIARHIDVPRARRKEQVGVVQSIVESSTELEPIALAHEERLGNAHVYVPETWPAERVSRIHVCRVWTEVGDTNDWIGVGGIKQRLATGSSKWRICEVVGNAGCSNKRRWGGSRDARRSGRIECIGANRQSIRAINNGKGRHGLGDEQRRNAPSMQRLLHYPVSVLGKRNLPDSRRRKPMTEIQVGIPVIYFRVERV